ncbi:MAG: ABC transporter permease [Nocardioidaceae bacterium]
MRAPDLVHPFGSDALGRDVLSRVIFAFRVSLAVAVGSVVLALVAGTVIGLIAGYFGGWVDTLLMRPIEMLLALPALLLAVSLIAIVGPGSLVALLAIAIIYLPIIARVIRASALVVSAQPFVEAARARGSSHRQRCCSMCFPTLQPRRWCRRAY